MILGQREIKAALDSGVWTCHRDGVQITSDELTINSNSVNVTLGNIELWPILDPGTSIDLRDTDSVMWAKTFFRQNELQPGDFSLAHVRERFDCAEPLLIDGKERYFAPMIEGRSTLGRCGLNVHATAGFGDYGFNANFTLELSSHLPIILRPGDEIAQVSFVEVSSPTPYQSVYSDQYDEPRAPVIGKGRFGK